MAPTKDDRQARLAAALRENLRRRKAQARAKADAAAAAPSEAAAAAEPARPVREG